MKRLNVTVTCMAVYCSGIDVPDEMTLEEAIEIAKDDAGVIPIPDDGTFMDGSWEVDCFDEDYLREWYNGNQIDEYEEKMKEEI